MVFRPKSFLHNNEAEAIQCPKNPEMNFVKCRSLKVLNFSVIVKLRIDNIVGYEVKKWWRQWNIGLEHID